MARKPPKGSFRNVVTGRSDGYTGRVPFDRLDVKTVAFESLLARDFLVQTAAFEPDLTAIVSEPCRVEVQHNGAAFNWIPDYRIERDNGRVELIEVKPIEVVDPSRSTTFEGSDAELEAACNEAETRFRSMRDAVERMGCIFRLVTEDEIRVEPRLGNASLVLRHAHPLFPLAWVLAGMEVLATKAIVDIPAFQTALPSLDAFVIALRLQWSGDLIIDPTRPFTRESRFERVGQTDLSL